MALALVHTPCKERRKRFALLVGSASSSFVVTEGDCVVAGDCLGYALDTNQDSGIWGGLTEEERRVIRRRRVAAMRAARAS